MKKRIVKGVTQEIAKNVYNDGGKPIVKPVGELIGLVPRAIRAALYPLEKWIVTREYNLAETKKLLEAKLQGTPPENIESPDPYIAVPALQYISYCMDNDELRNMYANLLANSMNRVVKNGVHPGFVEIIKQLCPDEAKILRYLANNEVIPTITLRFQNSKGEGTDVLKNYTNVGTVCKCEQPYEINKYFNNLVRLGLAELSPILTSLTDKKLYESLKEDPYLIEQANTAASRPDDKKNVEYVEGYVSISDYGIAFCRICLGTEQTEAV